MNLEDELRLKKLILSGGVDFQLVILFLINRYIDDKPFLLRIQSAIEYFKNHPPEKL